MTTTTGTNVALRRYATGTARTPLLTRKQQRVAGASGGELLPGQRAGEYVVDAMIAAGGGGSVYRVRHRVLGRLAALKVLHRELLGSDIMIARFLREARAMSALRHPAVADVYELGTLVDGRPFYVMELLQGVDLDAHLRVGGRLAMGEVLAVFEPICDALYCAHGAGLVHRDVKASNVFLVEVRRLGAPRVKLLDFGVAKAATPAGGLTSASVRVGTPTSMAPEQILGEPVDARTDVYALGVLLYHAVTGELPFEADEPGELEWMHLEAPPPVASARAPVPPAIDRVIEHAMAKRPGDRIATASRFLSELRAAVAAPHREGARGGDAVAIFVEAALAPDAEVEPDDELIDAVAGALDRAAQQLAAAGYIRIVETGFSLLWARVHGQGGACEAISEAAALSRELARVASCDEPKVQLRIEVRADRAVLRGDSIIGGPVTRLASAKHPVASGATRGACNPRLRL
jgi:tRNA A-37 threonylcarbamoyl transferase component Bud32